MKKFYPNAGTMEDTDSDGKEDPSGNSYCIDRNML